MGLPPVFFRKTNTGESPLLVFNNCFSMLDLYGIIFPVIERNNN